VSWVLFFKLLFLLLLLFIGTHILSFLHKYCCYILDVYMCLVSDCRIRACTLERLYDLTDGALGRIMREVTADEPIAPLLAEQHLKAMDRRLAIVLHAVDDFVRDSSIEAVLVTDGFS